MILININLSKASIFSAIVLIYDFFKQDLTDLLKTYGPNEDSMLMHLCCKRDEPPLIRAQVKYIHLEVSVEQNIIDNKKIL